MSLSRHLLYGIAAKEILQYGGLRLTHLVRSYVASYNPDPMRTRLLVVSTPALGTGGGCSGAVMF